MINVVKTSKQVVEGTLTVLSKGADKVLEHPALVAASQARGGLNGALGLVVPTDEASQEVVF